MRETNGGTTDSIIASEAAQRLSGCYVTADVEWKHILGFELMDRSVVLGEGVDKTFIADDDERRQCLHISSCSHVWISALPGPFMWLKLGLCFLCSWAGTWISHQETSESGFEMVFYHLGECETVSAWNDYYHRKGLACDVSRRLTRAIMLGKTSLVRVCACLKERQRTSELMSSIFPFPFSRPIILWGKKDSVSFQMPKSKSHTRQIRSVFVFLLLSLFILKFRCYNAYFCLLHRSKICILWFVIWHKTILNLEKM